jgi:uncharacterized protein YqeY
VTILERIQVDTRDAMKAREKERVGTLRMLASALQQEAKLGDGDEIAVLRREHKRRLEAADAYRKGGREDRAATEEGEATLIEEYLPDQLGDEELERLVADAIADAGASSPGDMGKVMGTLMPKLDGRADGKRVSAEVRAQLEQNK